MNNFEFEYKFFKNEDFTRSLTLSVWLGTKRKEVKIFDNFMHSIQDVKQYLTDLETRYPNMIIKWDKIFEGVIETNDSEEKELCLMCNNESRPGLILCVECAEKYRKEKVITLPTYYGVDLAFYEENGKYYMHILEWTNERTEISKEFFETALKEFYNEKQWEDMKGDD